MTYLPIAISLALLSILTRDSPRACTETAGSSIGLPLFWRNCGAKISVVAITQSVNTILVRARLSSRKKYDWGYLGLPPEKRPQAGKSSRAKSSSPRYQVRAAHALENFMWNLAYSSDKVLALEIFMWTFSPRTWFCAANLTLPLAGHLGAPRGGNTTIVCFFQVIAPLNLYPEIIL